MQAFADWAAVQDTLQPDGARFTTLVKAFPRVRAAFNVSAVEREHGVPIVDSKVHGKYAEPAKIRKLFKQ